MKRILSTLGLALLLAAILPTVSFGGNPNPGVLPPNSHAYGMTYAEWSARWWQWAVSMPLDHNPLNDTADCSTAQLGKVWFLGGAFGPEGKPERWCNVPTGKALFVPIIDVDCSSLELPPFYGGTPEERRACVKAMTDTVYGLSAEIDGVSLEDLTIYRTPSPDFHFVVPDNNVLFVPAGEGYMAGDGYYLLLAPLSKGQHMIHFKGSFGFPNFTSEETYHLTVGR
jgi:hypothetical protein